MTMEKADPQMEDRVWQRVHQGTGMPPLQKDNLKALILMAQEEAVACRELTLLLIGKQWEPLRRLEQESMKTVHSLRGLCALRGEPVKLTPLPPPRDKPRRALEKSFRRCRRLCQELESRCADPEFGGVYRSLTRRTEDHCAVLAELIGKLDA